MHAITKWLAAALALLLIAPTPVSGAWNQAKSKHFIIYSEQPADELRQFAERLEKFDRAVRVARNLEDPPLSDALRLTVYMLSDAAAVAKMAGAQGSGIAGFYVPRASGSVAFAHHGAAAHGRDAKWALGAEAVFFHEYFHHLMLKDLKASYPEWITEGWAEFFATARFEKDGSVGFGAPPAHRGFGLFALDDRLSLEEMVGATYKRLDPAQRELIYGRGWLLTHYLTFEPTRKGQLGRYLEGIEKGQTPLESARAAFGDLKKLNRELQPYLIRKTLGYYLVPAAQLTTGPITIRALNPGEQAIMNVRMRSDRGVDQVSAQEVASDARKIAARHPNDPFVQATLAEAEHDALRFDEAIAAADRALAADPNNAQALIYKGRALMERGRGASDKTDWAAVRTWFAKANRLDPDNPEPLMLFYQTYEASGAAPSPMAAEGLLYALEVVPQDSELRLLVVRHLLTNNKLSEAKNVLGPIAFNPHPRPGRDKAIRAMDAINAGDAKAALAALKDDEKDKKKKKG